MKSLKRLIIIAVLIALIVANVKMAESRRHEYEKVESFSQSLGSEILIMLWNMDARYDKEGGEYHGFYAGNGKNHWISLNYDGLDTKPLRSGILYKYFEMAQMIKTMLGRDLQLRQNREIAEIQDTVGLYSAMEKLIYENADQAQFSAVADDFETLVKYSERFYAGWLATYPDIQSSNREIAYTEDQLIGLCAKFSDGIREDAEFHELIARYR
jgi:hypothetical protein